jgi:elongation factor Ts
MSQVTAPMVKALRDRTGAGMMDCKNALLESGGDEEKAVELIQKRGLAKAAKKAGAIAAEGVVHGYIHPGNRVGVLLEVNCQTDFVARNEEFRSFVEGVAMQIASMSPLFVRREDIGADEQQRQREIFKGQLAEEEAKSGKERPAQAKEQIVEGKLGKWMAEACLVEQPYIMDESGKKTVQQVTDELAAKIGEKITIRRFTRYELGEGIERKKQDLAADVAETLKGA